MIFNYSKIAHSAFPPKRSGVSLFMYDDTDKMEGVTTEDITVIANCGWHQWPVTVPKDTYTDFASTPKFIWGLIPPVGKHTRAAIIHDYLYTKHECNRQEADYVFRDLMKKNGVPFFRRWIMWLGVRIFGGGKHWKSKES